MTCVQMFLAALLEVAVVRIAVRIIMVAGLHVIYDVLFVEWSSIKLLPILSALGSCVHVAVYWVQCIVISMTIVVLYRVGFCSSCPVAWPFLWPSWCAEPTRCDLPCWIWIPGRVGSSLPDNHYPISHSFVVALYRCHPSIAFLVFILSHVSGCVPLLLP